VQVTGAFTVSVRKDGTLVRLEWADGGGNYAVESTDDLSKSWGLSVVVNGNEFIVPQPEGQRFFRVRRDP
jgi:ribose 1,5-bisphosphokinase PhnN